MIKIISGLSRKPNTRELEARMSFDFEEIENDSKTKEDFLEKVKSLLYGFFEFDFCFLVLKEKGDFLISADHPSENYDEETIIELAEKLIRYESQLIIKNTKKHSHLKKQNINSLIATSIKAGDCEGAIILGYKNKKSFSKLDSAKLSAIQKGFLNSLNKIKVKEELQNKKKELEIIEYIDNLRRTITDSTKLISAVLEEVKREVSCGISFFYLNGETEKFIIAGRPESSIFVQNNKQVLIDLAKETLEEFELKEFDPVNKEIANTLCIPFIVSENSQGVIGVSNAEMDYHTKRVLQIVAKQISYAVSEDWEKSQIKTVFSKYVSPEIMESMLDNTEQDYLKTKKGEVTVLFSDIRGFTSLSERVLPEKLVEMLNDYFNVMTKIILKNKGTVDKFIGDAIMAVWGAPLYQGSHAYRAVKAALEMQEAHQELERKYLAEEIPFKIGIGVATGEAVIGNIGSNLKMDYTVIGDVVNTASRICSVSKSGQILISENTYLEAGKNINVIELTPIKVKNKQHPLQVYSAIGLKETGYGRADPYTIKNHISEQIKIASV